MDKIYFGKTTFSHFPEFFRRPRANKFEKFLRGDAGKKWLEKFFGEVYFVHFWGGCFADRVELFAALAGKFRDLAKCKNRHFSKYILSTHDNVFLLSYEFLLFSLAFALRNPDFWDSYGK